MYKDPFGSNQSFYPLNIYDCDQWVMMFSYSLFYAKFKPPTIFFLNMYSYIIDLKIVKTLDDFLHYIGSD